MISGKGLLIVGFVPVVTDPASSSQMNTFPVTYQLEPVVSLTNIMPSPLSLILATLISKE